MSLLPQAERAQALDYIGFCPPGPPHGPAAPGALGPRPGAAEPASGAARHRQPAPPGPRGPAGPAWRCLTRRSPSPTPSRRPGSGDRARLSPTATFIGSRPTATSAGPRTAGTGSGSTARRRSAPSAHGRPGSSRVGTPAAGGSRRRSSAKPKPGRRREREQREQERLAQWSAVAERARRIWDESEPATAHPYLTRKRVEPFGTRVRGELLVVPLYTTDGRLWSLQFIAPGGRKTLPEGRPQAGLLLPHLLARRAP